MNTAEKLQELYLDYLNNYLSIAVFSEHNRLTEQEGATLVALGRIIHNRLATTGDIDA